MQPQTEQFRSEIIVLFPMDTANVLTQRQKSSTVPECESVQMFNSASLPSCAAVRCLLSSTRVSFYILKFAVFFKLVLNAKILYNQATKPKGEYVKWRYLLGEQDGNVTVFLVGLRAQRCQT